MDFLFKNSAKNLLKINILLHYPIKADIVYFDPIRLVDSTTVPQYMVSYPHCMQNAYSKNHITVPKNVTKERDIPLAFICHSRVREFKCPARGGYENQGTIRRRSDLRAYLRFDVSLVLYKNP